MALLSERNESCWNLERLVEAEEKETKTCIATGVIAYLLPMFPVCSWDKSWYFLYVPLLASCHAVPCRCCSLAFSNQAGMKVHQTSYLPSYHPG